MNEITSIKRPFFGLLYAISMSTLLCIPFFAQAEGPVIRSGNTVTTEANHVLEGDFYGFGGNVTLSGASENDVYVAGGTVTINAPVSEDLVIIGGTVQVHGEVSDDVRIIGGEVVIAKQIADDLVVIGGSVRILSTATIGGDLIVLAGDVTVNGPVKGTVYGRAEIMRIDSYVGGDITIGAGESLSLGDSAEVVGNISYTSRNDIVRAQGAVVNGSITRDSLMEKAQVIDVRNIVLSMLVLIFSSLTVFFIARTRTERLVSEAWSMYGRSGLIGLGMLLAIPIVVVILMSSLIGVVVGIGLAFLYMFLLILTCISLPIFIGAFCERIIRKENRLSLFTLMLGIITTTVLSLIPILGTLIILLVALVIFGALCLELYRVFRTS